MNKFMGFLAGIASGTIGGFAGYSYSLLVGGHPLKGHVMSACFASLIVCLYLYGDKDGN